VERVRSWSRVVRVDEPQGIRPRRVWLFTNALIVRHAP